MQNATTASKTVIITGANSGWGYQCAKAIAKRSAQGAITDSKQDWLIIIASRSLSRVEEAVRQLITETSYPHIEGMVLDLASLASVRQFVQNVSSRPPLQAIICNAGLAGTPDTPYTKDGFEIIFGVNHLGHFLLVNLLLPYIDRARIVFVSSDTHNPEAKTGVPHPQYRDAKLLAFPDSNPENMSPRDIERVRYTTSKLCNILCAYELSRRLQRKGLDVTVNAFNPGLMLDTRLARNLSQAELAALKATISPAILEKARDAETMGSALARLILDPALAGVTGKYFDGFEEVCSSKESYDERKATQLWESSVELVKLAPEEALL